MKIKLSKNGAVCEVDSMGGEIVSYRTASGLSCLWEGDPDVWAGHSPHLFPIIGTLSQGRHWLNGRWYEMGKHGFLRGTEFSVQERTSDSIVLLRRDNESSFDQYPFSFSFFVTHTLLQNGLETSYRVINHSKSAMPFCVGGHPAFSCPVFEDEVFSDYELQLPDGVASAVLCAESDDPLAGSKNLRLPIRNNSLPLSHDYLKDNVLIFENTGCQQVTLHSKKHSYAAQLSFQGFANFAIWTFGSKQAKYLCIEPWQGLPCMKTDGISLTDKPYCIQLKPGCQREFVYRIRFFETQ